MDELTPADRAAKIIYLAQNPFLFSGTIRDNILLSLSGDESKNDHTHSTAARGWLLSSRISRHSLMD